LSFCYRDNYDKEVRAKKPDKPKCNQRPKKPNIDVYVPPTRQKKGSITVNKLLSTSHLFLLTCKDEK